MSVLVPGITMSVLVQSWDDNVCAGSWDVKYSLSETTLGSPPVVCNPHGTDTATLSEEGRADISGSRATMIIISDASSSSSS